MKTIDVKVAKREQLFSQYSFAANKLNPEFGDYLYEAAKDGFFKDTITINIHTHDNLQQDEVAAALQTHYHIARKENKEERTHLLVVSLFMATFAIIALTMLILIHHAGNNFYFAALAEIATWVFIWETVDNFFLQLPKVRMRGWLLKQLSNATVNIHQDNTPKA